MSFIMYLVPSSVITWFLAFSDCVSGGTHNVLVIATQCLSVPDKSIFLSHPD